nr:MAG TPA: hypothetical protein [Bacteriophage sp.]
MYNFIWMMQIYNNFFVYPNKSVKCLYIIK